MLRGFAADNDADTARLHAILRDYSQRVTQFLTGFLQPYADKWLLDFASFRPLEEQGRDLPLHKRNDLLHVDAFPTRPTHGGRILRYFTNVNPLRPRVWNSTDESFAALAQRFAGEAGLKRFAARGLLRGRDMWRRIRRLKRVVGLPAPITRRTTSSCSASTTFSKRTTTCKLAGPRSASSFRPTAPGSSIPMACRTPYSRANMRWSRP